MKILSLSENRKADAYTIEHEPVPSIDLMERAAKACTGWLTQHIGKTHPLKIFCGTGNNGGDGLVIARLLIESGFEVQTFVLQLSEHVTNNFKINEQRLRRLSDAAVIELTAERDFPPVSAEETVIDALFGTGLTRSVEGLPAGCIRHINRSGAKVIAIDLPSGLFADEHTPHESAVIHADYTLTFNAPNLAFLFAENENRVGEWHVLDIGLNKDFISSLPSKNYFITGADIRSISKARAKFSHKGNYGHALLIAGSFGKIGAAVLAAKACLRTGAGLLTVHVPACGYPILQSTVPEALVATDEDEKIFTSAINTEGYTAVGAGCGIGTNPKTKAALLGLLTAVKSSLVLDADALNILSESKNFFSHLPENSVLTPHPKEFERLAGKAQNDFQRHELQLEFAKKHRLLVVLKGAHTCIACPDGSVYFNSTGNPGMAKGGTGDALTGVILSLLAQGYAPAESCIAGVYLHGLAGDKVALKTGLQSLLASDLIEHLGEAFLELEKTGS